MSASHKEVQASSPGLDEPSREEVRAYLIDMTAQFAALADRYRLPGLATLLRDVAAKNQEGEGDERDDDK